MFENNVYDANTFNHDEHDDHSDDLDTDDGNDDTHYACDGGHHDKYLNEGDEQKYVPVHEING